MENKEFKAKNGIKVDEDGKCPHVHKDAPVQSLCEDCYQDMLGERQENFCN